MSLAVPSLKVMTYNLRNADAQDSLNSWPLRQEALVELVKRTDPDILGVQEALEVQMEALREALPGHDVLGAARENGLAEGERVALFTRRSRLGLREGGTRWISREPDRPGSLGGSARLTRIFTWGEFFLESGVRILVMNVHLDHESPSARLLGAGLMKSLAMERQDLPALAMGDFNSGPMDEPAQTLCEGGRLALLRPQKGPFGTFCGFDASVVDGEVIDHVLASPEWRVEGTEIVRAGRDGRAPSDHFPVVATVALG